MRHSEVSTIFNFESQYAQLFTYTCILASILLIPTGLYRMPNIGFEKSHHSD